MHKIAVIIPYFGNLPNYFKFFIASCKNNPSIDWLIFSDMQTTVEMPKNVHYNIMTWDELRGKFQKNFNFPICLNRPYKLCDFRPSFGEVFREDLIGYDYWAYGDMDLIYGDLRKFLTAEKLENYDRIYVHGHLSVFKNTPYINGIYKKIVDGCCHYDDVFSDERSYTFDEWGQGSTGGFYQIFSKYGKIYNRVECADIDTKFWRFRCNFGGPPEKVKKEMKRRQVYFSYEGGSLYMCMGGSKPHKYAEVMYLHLQKRKMKVKKFAEPDKVFYIYPNEITNKRKKLIFEIGYNPQYIKYVFKSISKKLRIS